MSMSFPSGVPDHPVRSHRRPHRWPTLMAIAAGVQWTGNCVLVLLFLGQALGMHTLSN
jgi:hypothetical protein